MLVIEQHALHNLLPIAQELFEDKEKNRYCLVQHFFITDELCTIESQPKCQYFIHSCVLPFIHCHYFSSPYVIETL